VTPEAVPLLPAVVPAGAPAPAAVTDGLAPYPYPPLVVAAAVPAGAPVSVVVPELHAAATAATATTAVPIHHRRATARPRERPVLLLVPIIDLLSSSRPRRTDRSIHPPAGRLPPEPRFDVSLPGSYVECGCAD
jgi:hypothetical protein